MILRKPKLLIFILLVNGFISSYSQEIDPRQYIFVQYRKTPTKGGLDTIWNWEERKNVPNQKFNILDIDGEIKITFDKLNLATNEDFEGTFSLEAEISGLNGTRRIEVNPYSEIGIQRKTIGVKSEPPTQLTVKLLNLIRELGNADSVHRVVYIDLTGRKRSKEYEERNLLEIQKIRKLVEDVDLETLITEARAIERGVNTRYIDHRDTLNFFSGVSTKQQFILALRRLELKYTIINNDVSYMVEREKAVVLYLADKLNIVSDYVNSFENGGGDALRAILSLINKDVVSYRALKARLNRYQVGIASLTNNVKISTSDNAVDQLVLNNLDLLRESIDFLYDFSKLRGTPLAKIIKDLADTINVNGIQIPDYNVYGYYDYLELRAQRSALYDFIGTYSDELTKLISIEAARLIYKKLVYASIDLGKSGAQNGEVMNLYVTWIQDAVNDSLSNSPRLPIGKYYLRETGWKFDIADMFALVKRIEEHKVVQDKVSPSNFKGSGGAVLMWTFYKQDRGLNIAPNSSGFSVKKRNRVSNFFEPSIGINVSYLDFSTEKDVEIGVGLQGGLFRNKIFVGYGVNLHMLSPKNQSPKYFYIGFSFAKLSDLFKDSNSIKSSL
jgi:hypothetical protein